MTDREAGFCECKMCAEYREARKLCWGVNPDLLGPAAPIEAPVVESIEDPDFPEWPADLRRKWVELKKSLTRLYEAIRDMMPEVAELRAKAEAGEKLAEALKRFLVAADFLEKEGWVIKLEALEVSMTKEALAAWEKAKGGK